MQTTGCHPHYPLPPHFDPAQVGEVWKVAYQDREKEASRWANQHQIQSAETDDHKIALIIIDAQNTFCIPGFELFVGGKTGLGAVKDNRACANLFSTT